MITGSSGRRRRIVGEHVEAAAAGQHDVEQDEVEVAGERHPLALLAVGGALGGEALRAQGAFQEAGDARLVLDDQNPHRLDPRWRWARSRRS